MEWISVEDRLPEYIREEKYQAWSDTVIILHSFRPYAFGRAMYDYSLGHLFVEINGYGDKRNLWLDAKDDDELGGVTHWMPLPEPPKSKDKEEA